MPQRRVVTGRSQQPRQRFVEELKALRAARGDSLRRLGEVLGWDWSLFGKMESGDTLGGPEVIQALDQHYGTPGLLLTLWELAIGDPTQFKEQYRRYMVLEGEAVSLWHYAPGVLPGLLQTAGYATELLASGGAGGEDLTQQVEARVRRAELLGGKHPPHFRTILSEAVLRTRLREPAEYRAQLEHLAEMAGRPNIALQVVRNEVGLHGLRSTDLMFLRMHDGETTAYVENDHRGELITESSRVEALQRRYDAMRDLALSPAESAKFVERLLEEEPCDVPT
ncbi:helix-turn-helix domain-containing protein [Streptomyces sp. 8L]|uniref:helix-turn-helix domain-containing protein n=1 Tax=Streptomyces sp. 8L TaxID=2877242 RepID=UPI001CD45580|nr:helix-turn-helix transcriptional regulator [Streptomyces sp. 8L]MCA1221698.1 helix-turn-helix domain-containing protein [Streptomyces sp. 8L]